MRGAGRRSKLPLTCQQQLIDTLARLNDARMLLRWFVWEGGHLAECGLRWRAEEQGKLCAWLAIHRAAATDIAMFDGKFGRKIRPEYRSKQLGKGRTWSGRRVSNSRPQPWQGCALPTELLPRGVMTAMRTRKCKKTGAGEESRTLDLNLGKVALYQLSYSRMGRYYSGRRAKLLGIFRNRWIEIGMSPTPAMARRGPHWPALARVGP